MTQLLFFYPTIYPKVDALFIYLQTLFINGLFISKSGSDELIIGKGQLGRHRFARYESKAT